MAYHKTRRAFNTCHRRHQQPPPSPTTRRARVRQLRQPCSPGNPCSMTTPTTQNGPTPRIRGFNKLSWRGFGRDCRIPRAILSEGGSRPVATMTGGEALVKSLANEGVEVVFGIPGIQIYGIIAALRDEPGIRMITTPARAGYDVHGGRLRALFRKAGGSPRRTGSGPLQRGVRLDQCVRAFVAGASHRRTDPARRGWQESRGPSMRSWTRPEPYAR